MGMLQEIAAERRARLIRLGGPIARPFATKIVEKEPIIEQPEEIIPVVVTSHKEPVTAQEWLQYYSSEQNRKEITIRDVKYAVCKYFSLTLTAIDSDRRTLKLVYPRQIAFFLCRLMTLRSLPEIGRRFGDRDHTTVLHGAKKIERLVVKDWQVAYDVAHIEMMI